MTASEMTIEQNDDSMGVSYDVGRYRDVFWGKSERNGVKIEAGWDDRALVVRTDGERMDVSETYTVDESGERLTREVVIHGGMGKREFTRVFDRKKDRKDRKDQRVVVEELGE